MDFLASNSKGKNSYIIEQCPEILRLTCKTDLGMLLSPAVEDTYMQVHMQSPIYIGIIYNINIHQDILMPKFC
jgi:hypothetical protein